MLWRRSKDPVEIFIAQLRKRKPALRLQAVESLGKTGDPRAIGPLIDALGDKEGSVQHKAINMLSEIGLPAVNALLAALEREDSRIQKNAVEILGNIGDVQAIHGLIELLGETHSDIWQHAANALQRIGTPVIPYLWDTLEDIEYAIREHALELLGKIDDPQATEYLIRALGHHSSYIREKATEVLGRMAPITELRQTLTENNPLLISQAIDALGEIGGGQVILPLQQALAHEDWQVRQHAVNALAKLNEPQAIETFAKVLHDPYQQVRESVIEALGQRNDDHSIMLLAKALNDTSPHLRARVVSLLGAIKDYRVVEPLIAALNDSEFNIRRHAIEHLGRIGDSRAIRPLVQILKTNQPFLQEQAARSLDTFWDARVISELLQLLQSINTFGGDEVRKLLTTLLPVVETVVFGKNEYDIFDMTTTLYDPNVSALTLSMINLKTIAISTEHYEFHLIEQFITYAINTIGQVLLKKQVVVEVYGAQELHPHLWNNLQNFCKTIEKRETMRVFQTSS